MRTIDSTFQFSHSLVSSYEGWLNAESDYNKYFGNSENPPAWEDYELSKKLEFYVHLFKLDLKPEFEREDTALLLGKEFENMLNERIECGVFGFKNNKNECFNVFLNEDYDNLLHNRINIEKRTGKPISRQVKIEGILPNGLNFIGYADEVYDNCVIDIKTTSNFNRDNYNNSLQIPLYLHFLPYPITRGFYQVTEFYRSKSNNEFTQKDTFVIEAQPITQVKLQRFSDLCAEILRFAHGFRIDVENYSQYFNL